MGHSHRELNPHRTHCCCHPTFWLSSTYTIAHLPYYRLCSEPHYYNVTFPIMAIDDCSCHRQYGKRSIMADFYQQKEKRAKFACLNNKSSVIITRLNDQCEKIFTVIMNTIFEALPEEVEGGRRLTVRKMRENLW